MLNARAAGGRGNAEPGGEPPTPELLLNSRGLSPTLYRRMTRVVSFVFIGSAMAVVALTGTANAEAIIALLALALILIELFQDVLPASALGRLRLPLEAVILISLLTVLIAITGGKDSPYFFGYILLVGGTALSTSRIAATIVAVISGAAYLGAVAYAAYSAPLAAADLGFVAFNLVAIVLVAYVASVIGREQRRAREAALELSMFDSLTGLLTTRFFVIAVEQEIARTTRSRLPFAVIQVDLDGMKAANDRFGLDAGDRLIRAAADAIRAAVRATDVVARNSGGADEFFVMLPETDQAGADLVAEKIRSDIGAVRLPRDNGIVRATASIGVVSYPDDGRTWTDLKNGANQAERQAKAAGGDQVRRLGRDARAVSGSTHTERRSASARNERAEPLLPDASPGPAPWELT